MSSQMLNLFADSAAEAPPVAEAAPTSVMLYEVDSAGGSGYFLLRGGYASFVVELGAAVSMAGVMNFVEPVAFDYDGRQLTGWGYNFIVNAGDDDYAAWFFGDQDMGGGAYWMVVASLDKPYISGVTPQWDPARYGELAIRRL